MSKHEEDDANVSGNIEFRWGDRGRHGEKNPKIKYYESFTYDGVDYSLYDSVYLWCEGQEPHIGKIIQIYETPRMKKMIKVVWYFRPSEVQAWLRGTRYLDNELFLASGEGIGLSNFNPLETVCGKCNVVCTFKDEKNREATMEELTMSDRVFYRTFDVGKCVLSEKFPDKIDGVEVGHFFNPKPKGNCGVTDNTSTMVLESAASPNSPHSKQRRPQDFESGKRKGIEVDRQATMVKKRPKVDKSGWFKKLPWEDRILKADKLGSLVLLENLNPSLTSAEVEDIVLEAFNLKVAAKMIQWSAFSSPHNGQALVIFASKANADFAISELETRCLMISDARPVVGSRPLLKTPGNHNRPKYFGHITINAVERKQFMNMENAVSTAHPSQPNTIEFTMAMEWQTHQKKWELLSDAFYKQQAKEIANVKALLKGPDPYKVSLTRPRESVQ